MLRDKLITVTEVTTVMLSGKKYLVLETNKYNSPVTISPVQEKIIGHIDFFVAIWWALWGATLIYVAGRYLFIPFFKKICG